MDPLALLQEVQLLRECRNANVLTLLDFCGNKCVPCMATLLMRGGLLDNQLLRSPAARE